LGQDAAAADTLRVYLASDGVRDRAAATAELRAIEARLQPPAAAIVAPAPPPSRVPKLRRAVIGSGIATAVLALTAGALTIGAAIVTVTLHLVLRHERKKIAAQ